MSIIYVLVGKQDKILADYTSYSGNFNLTANQILKRSNSSKKYLKYAANNYIFYILNVDDVVYLAMCQSKYSQRIAFSFLQKIRKMFVAAFDQQSIKRSKMYQFKAFSNILKENLQLYNTPQQVDNIARLMKQTEEVSQIINEDLQKVINRGQKIQVLVRKTQTMSSLSLDLRNTSKVVRDQMRWKNWKMRIFIALFIGGFIYFLLIMFCGGFALQQCF